MCSTDSGDLIRQASRHVAAALETLNQMRAIHSFGRQRLVDGDSVRNEVMILAKKYRSELRHSSQLVVQFLENEDPLLDIPPL